ncbi:DUF937 domain-containing protein [Bacteroidales bacterium OttesenSCG-928-L03]|nr:DUF937 domain-containing protein [Bacteroidales bacterium OttesenSCG-928-L03]
MSQFFNSIKALITPDMVEKAAHTVDEKPADIQRAFNIIIPGLLAMYLKKHSPTTNNILRKAGNLDVLKDRDLLCEEKARTDQAMVADDFLQHILGDQAASFSDPIAEATGIPKVAVNRLVYMAAPMVAGAMGDKLVRENWSTSGLINEIGSMKPQLLSGLPKELVQSMDLSYILHSSGNTKTNNNKGIIWAIVLVAIVAIAAAIYYFNQ